MFDQFDNPHCKLLIHDEQFTPGNKSSTDIQVNRVLGMSIEPDNATGIKPRQCIGREHGRTEFD